MPRYEVNVEEEEAKADAEEVMCHGFHPVLLDAVLFSCWHYFELCCVICHQN